MIGVYGAIFWLVIAVIFFVIEGLTVQMVCIWFAAGAVFAMLAAFVEMHFWVQMLIFLVTSILVLVIGRPLLVDKIKPKKVATNADRVIGQVGVVLEQIDNLEQTGRVSANGLIWTARSEFGSIIPVQSKVLVKYIDGVKLIVEPIQILQQEPGAAEQPET